MPMIFKSAVASQVHRGGSGLHSGCCDDIRQALKVGPMQTKELCAALVDAAGKPKYTMRQIAQAINVLSTKSHHVSTNGKSPATYTSIEFLRASKPAVSPKIREFVPLVRDPFAAMNLAISVKR
jgi:hypothetical protein